MVYSPTDSWHSRGARADLGMEFGRAVGKQGLDRSLKDVAELESAVEGRRLGAVLPAGNLGGVPMPEALSHVFLRELLRRTVPPEAVGDGAFWFWCGWCHKGLRNL